MSYSYLFIVLIFSIIEFEVGTWRQGRVGEVMIMTSFPIGLIAGMMAFIVLALPNHNSSLPSHCHFHLLNFLIKLVVFVEEEDLISFCHDGLLSYIFYYRKLLKRSYFTFPFFSLKGRPSPKFLFKKLSVTFM